MWAAQDVSGETIGTVPWVIYRIQFRKAWVAAPVIRVVLKGNVGKAVGVENEMAADGSPRRNLANGGQVWVGIGHTAVDCGNNRGHAPGVQHVYRCDDSGVGKNRIAGPRGSGVCGIGCIPQPRRNIEGEAG